MTADAPFDDPLCMHARRALQHRERIQYWVGGEQSEDDARLQWNLEDVPVIAPFITDPEAGTDHLIGLLREGRLFVMDHLVGLRAELGTYSRDLDGGGRSGLSVVERERFRLLVSARYAASVFEPKRPEHAVQQPPMTIAQQRAAILDAIQDREDGILPDNEGMIEEATDPRWSLPMWPRW